jgi:hypothetical protein
MMVSLRPGLAAEDDVLHPDLKTGVGRVVIEQAETERVQACEERHVGVLSKRIAQGERAVRRELGHQPIGDRFQALIFLGLLRAYRTTDLCLWSFG